MNGDAHGNTLPLMTDLVREADLASLLHAAGIVYSETDNFESVYETLVTNPAKGGAREAIEARLREYFARLALPPNVTTYDRLLLSLRSKDVIATFNWDPLIVQAYKRNRLVGDLPRLLFLHGNVDVGACVEHQQKGFLEHTCPQCRRPLPSVPLLYPIGEKNYDENPFIRNEWTELRESLEEAYILTIFGYAAPTSDEVAKQLMLAAWDANQSRELAQIEIVDVKPREVLEATWSPFFVRDHYGVGQSLSWLFRHPRRSCDHFAMASLQNAPCRETPLPDTEDLEALQAWVAPLIEEERALRDKGTPFPC